jgi:hypothetical protein
LEDAPEELRRLPEPLRTKALEAANELLAKEPGIEREEALRRAIDQAQEFQASRIPHAREPEKSG